MYTIPFAILNELRVLIYYTVTSIYTFTFQRICENISSIETLLLKSENELKSILPEYSLKDEELRRLTRASYNLKKYSGKFSI